MIGKLAKFVTTVVLAAACCGAAIAAESPFASIGALDSYLDTHRRDLERTLDAYNKRHRLTVSGVDRAQLDILSWEIDELGTDRAVVLLRFEVGVSSYKTPGEALFELRWDGDSIEIAGHRQRAPQAEVQPATAAAEGAPAVKPFDDVTDYIEQNEADVKRKLGAYNKKHRVVVSEIGSWSILDFRWNIDRLTGDRAFLEIRYTVGQRGWAPSPGEALFELRWVGNDLEFVGHGPIPKKRGAASGWLERGDDLCVHNYYAPRPCIDAVRGWTEFAETHGLALDPGSAAIYQSYKHSDFATGDRLMARARGLPDPEGGSVFGLQAEVRAMNLSRYQGNAEVGCDLNPLGPRPCVEILPIYQELVRRHGLAENASSAAMFEAYAQGNYRKADVIYALAKGLDVPAYGYLPTGAARDVAKLWPRLNFLLGDDMRQPCSTNPYMPENDRYRPCPEILTMWREFAERYQLDDNAENANIFAQYAAGEYRAGDQLLAQAKGVSLEQLLEASGVPTEGLIIEVYPGTPQRMERVRTGT